MNSVRKTETLLVDFYGHISWSCVSPKRSINHNHANSVICTKVEGSNISRYLWSGVVCASRVGCATSRKTILKTSHMLPKGIKRYIIKR